MYKLYKDLKKITNFSKFSKKKIKSCLFDAKTSTNFFNFVFLVFFVQHRGSTRCTKTQQIQAASCVCIFCICTYENLGKHGTIADWGVTDDAGSKVFYDVNLPLWGTNSVAARSVVLHDAASGARTACGNFGHMCSVWDRQPKYDEIKIDYNGEDVWGYQVLQQMKGCPWCATSVKSHALV